MLRAVVTQGRTDMKGCRWRCLALEFLIIEASRAGLYFQISNLVRAGLGGECTKIIFGLVPYQCRKDINLDSISNEFKVALSAALISEIISYVA